MSAQVERRYDEYETMASEAMMMRSAYHAKKLKYSDLYKRPNVDENKAESMRTRADYTMEWLSQFEEFGGKE